MKLHISYQLDNSTIEGIKRIANRRGISQSSLVELILKKHMTEYDVAERSSGNVEIGHLMDAIERSLKRKG